MLDANVHLRKKGGKSDSDVWNGIAAKCVFEHHYGNHVHIPDKIIWYASLANSQFYFCRHRQDLPVLIGDNRSTDKR